MFLFHRAAHSEGCSTGQQGWCVYVCLSAVYAVEARHLVAATQLKANAKGV